jgi:glyoxalase family protein
MIRPHRAGGFYDVTLVTDQPARAHDFYTEVLGLTDRPGRGFEGTSGAPGGWLRPSAPMAVVGGRTSGHWGIGGIHHVALSVPDEAALLRWKRRLHDLGRGSSGPYDRGYFHSLYFQDPDGHILELATVGPGYALDEPENALGARHIDPDPIRLKGNRDEAAIARALHPDPVPEITPDMAILGLHHVTGLTDDLDTAHDLWHGVLGLARIKQTSNQDDPATKHWFWGVWDGGPVAPASSMTLFGWPNSTYRARPGVGQVAAVALRAGPASALDAWRDHLRSVGLPLTAPLHRSDADAVAFHAPDGLLIELVADEATGR